MPKINLQSLLSAEPAQIDPAPRNETTGQELQVWTNKPAPAGLTMSEAQPSVQQPAPQPQLDDRSTLEVATDALARGGLQAASNAYSAFGLHEEAANIDRLIQTDYYARNPDITADNVDIAGFAGEAIASNAPDMLVSLGLLAVPVVGWAAAGAYAVSQVYGESRKMIYQETGEDSPYAALAPASINTLLELNPIVRVAKRLGFIKDARKSLADVAKEASERGFIQTTADALKFGSEIAIREGAVEVAQNLSNLATVRVLKDQGILDKLSPEEQSGLINDFFGGMFAGGALGGGAELVNKIGFEKAAQKKVAEIEREIEQYDSLLNQFKEADAAKAAKQTAGLPIGGIEAGTPILPTDQGGSANVQVKNESRDSADNNTDPKAISDLLVSSIAEELSKTDFTPNQKLDIHTAVQNRIAELKAQLASLDVAFAQKPVLKNMFQETKGETYVDHYVGNMDDKLLSPFFTGFDNIFTNDLGELERSSPLYHESAGNVWIQRAEDDASLTKRFQGGIKHVMEIAQATNEILDKLGLTTNSVTGEPMKIHLLFRTDLGNEVAGASRTLNSTNSAISFNLNKLNSRQAMDTLTHEIGHLIHTQMFASLEKTNPRLLDTFRSLYQESLLKETLRTDYVKKYTLFDMPIAGNIGKADKQQDIYETSFPEFMAEQFRKAISNKVGKGEFNLKTDAKSVFSYMLRKFRLAYRLVKDLAKKLGIENSYPNFEEYLDQMLAKKALRTAEDILAGKAEAQKEAGNILGERVKDTSQKVDSDIGLMMKAGKTLGVSPATTQALEEIVQLNMGFLGDSLRGRVFKSVMTPIQIAQQAERKGFSLPQIYMDLVQQMQALKMSVVERADGVLKAFGYNKETANRISKMAFTASTMSDELKRRLTSDEVEKLRKQLGLSDTDLAIWEDMDASFREIVDKLEASLTYDLARLYIKDRDQAKEFRQKYIEAGSETERMQLVEQYTGTPALDLSPDAKSMYSPFYGELLKISRNMESMRNKNYFPRSRLGNYYVRVVALEDDTTWEGYTGKKDSNVGYYSFDTKEEMMDFMKDVKPDEATSGSVRFFGGKVSPSIYSLQGQPNAVIQKVKAELEANGGLDKESREILNALSLDLAPGRKFLKHLTRRRGVAGYSTDVARVYGNYMTNASNHIARSEYASDLQHNLDLMDKVIDSNHGSKVVAQDLIAVADYFKRHFKYLMDNKNDWANIRAMGFLWYLGFNVKSAAVNFMQTPMVLYPVLAQHTSDANAVRRITGAIKDLNKAFKHSSSLEPDLLNTIDAMIKAGLLDESMVSDLAGMGEEGALKRLIPGFDMKTTYHKFAHAGGAMFRVGEKINRMITIIAAHRIAKDNGAVDQDAINTFVRDMIQTSQFEYSRFNRAEFMRGRRSIIFLFWQYMQHASYLLFGGQGSRTAMRMWTLALIVAGIEGLPFAELILDILDVGGTQIKKMLGYADPRVDLRKELRTIVQELEDYGQPDLWLKGTSYFWGLGPLHGLTAFGVPVPNVSTRGSLSYGDPVPWFDGITDPTVTDEEKLIYKSVAAFAGPMGGIALGGIQALYSDEDNAWKRWEKVMPIFARNASTGVRWAVEGQEKGVADSTMLTFTTPEQRAEAVIKSLGFQPTRVDQTRQQMRAVQVAVMYYEARRQALLDNIGYAYAMNDREGISDAMNAVHDYNKELMGKKELTPLVIGGDTLSRSIKGKLERKAEIEANVLQGMDNLLLQEEIQKLYPVKE